MIFIKKKTCRPFFSLCILFSAALQNFSIYAQALPDGNTGDLNAYMSTVNPFDRKKPLYTEVDVVTTAQNGSEKRMAYKMYTVRKNATVSIMIEFSQPAGYKDTRLLIDVPETGGAPNVAVMMNFFLTPFRIKQMQRSMPFFETDINSEDMNPRDTSCDEYCIISDGDSAHTQDTDMVTVRGIPLTHSSYSEMIYYIDTKKHMSLKTEFYRADGSLAKVLTVQKTAVINGIQTATKIKITDMKKKSYTVLTYKNTRYGEDHSAFVNEAYLKAGKPQVHR